jgi:hypothetical protein
MSDPVANLLHRLDKVRETKPDHWEACCPAHGDKTPSLAIARGDDGRVLLKCWAGCGAADVVQSVGLSLADLFVREERRHSRPGRRRVYPNYKNVLRLLRHESEVILIASTHLKEGKALSETDTAALERAHRNLCKVFEAANV